MKKILFGVVALAVLTLNSCKKDDDEPANITPTTANLSGSYKLAKITAQSGTNPEVDITNSVMPACEKDDVTTLNANGTYTIVDAGTQCSPAGGDSGTWSLVKSTTLSLDGSNVTIIRFNGTNLDLSESDPSFGTIRTYMVKQ